MNLLILVLLTVNADVAERCQNNTVIITYGRGHGSGVLFTRDNTTFVWTVGHVAHRFMRSNGSFDTATIVQGNKKAEARVLRASDYEITDDIALLQIIDRVPLTGDPALHEALNCDKNDIALMQVPNSVTGDAKFYRAFNHVKVGQLIIHVGTPGSAIHELSVFRGSVSYINRLYNIFPVLEPRFVDQINVTGGPGCSGGGVFDAETGGIHGFISLSTACGISFITPTRSIYEFAKTHDCLWAFDREVLLPDEIIPWRSDLYTRTITNRDYGDSRWGDPGVTCTIN